MSAHEKEQRNRAEVGGLVGPTPESPWPSTEPGM